MNHLAWSSGDPRVMKLFKDRISVPTPHPRLGRGCPLLAALVGYGALGNGISLL